MPILNLKIVLLSMLLLATQLFLFLADAEGFQNPRISLVVANSRSGTKIYNSNNDEDVNSPLPIPSSKSSNLEQGKFNPFDYRRNNKSRRSVGSTPPRVDLRSLRMTSLTSDLLTSLGDKEAIRSILEESRDFLLEPLEVEDSMAASGSIYTPSMSRAERYQAYRKSVNERLASSQNEKAKAVLKSMRDYVLEFEDESPY